MLTTFETAMRFKIVFLICYSTSLLLLPAYLAEAVSADFESRSCPSSVAKSIRRNRERLEKLEFLKNKDPEVLKQKQKWMMKAKERLKKAEKYMAYERSLTDQEQGVILIVARQLDSENKPNLSAPYWARLKKENPERFMPKPKPVEIPPEEVIVEEELPIPEIRDPLIYERNLELVASKISPIENIVRKDLKNLSSSFVEYFETQILPDIASDPWGAGSAVQNASQFKIPRSRLRTYKVAYQRAHYRVLYEVREKIRILAVGTRENFYDYAVNRF